MQIGTSTTCHQGGPWTRGAVRRAPLLYDDRRLCSICDPQTEAPKAAAAGTGRSRRRPAMIAIIATCLLIGIASLASVTWAHRSPASSAEQSATGAEGASQALGGARNGLRSIIQAERDAAVKSGLRAIKAGIQKLGFVDHGVYPTADQVKDSQDGIAAYMDAWPTNPFSSLPMSQGDAPGDYTYVQTISGYGLTLTGHLHAGGGDFVLP